MHLESEITVERPLADVHDYIAHAERLPDYVREFAWVKQSSPGEPAAGTEYSYEMATGQARGTFYWSEFDRGRLAWEGPPARAMPLGSMAPGGWWELSEQDGATRVKLVMAPRPGGVMKLFAPLMAGMMRKGNARALERLKELVEQSAGGQGAQGSESSTAAQS